MDTPSRYNDTDAQLRRALLAVKELRARLDAVERARTEPIAIIGMGCRFPGGANSPEAFWNLMCHGEDAIRETPADRWDGDALYDPDANVPGRIATRWGGYLDDVDRFDAAFFGISPREATRMDPQQRLLLEVAYDALEDGGQPIETLAGSKTGVFIGVHSLSVDYGLLQFAEPNRINAYAGTGTSHSVFAGRLSYLLNLTGPSIAIDTACSSSLVAVHLACQSIWNGESALALAGGVNLMLAPEFAMVVSRMGMLAADGRCKAFDSSADGIVRSEGCGLVLLKRLSEAISDGDRILAVIRGSAINQDGYSNGITAPNGQSQQDVIRQALAKAGVSPAQIGYVETHGTGTALGDPIEAEALVEVLGRANPDTRTCVIGAVKTNIGHAEGAAGVAGLIKAVLCLQHGAIPPNLHFTRLSPYVPFENTRFVIPTATYPWPAGGEPRYAGVSSFGWSGTNAHVVISEAPRAPEPAAPSAPADDEPRLLPLSARGPDALRALASSYRDFLCTREAGGALLRDVCYSASLRRTHFDHRLAVVGRSREDMAAQIDYFLQGERRPGVAAGWREPGPPAKLAFVFSGQGPQWWAMGRELLEYEPIFRATVERCDALLRPHAGWSLLAELTAAEADSRLEETEIAQPAIFALQVALAAVWRSWGITPDAVVGHSVGEIAAAHLAGALTLDDAVRVVYHRSRLMQQATGLGQMAQVELPLAEAERAIADYGDQLAIAAVNGPRTTVLSGAAAALGAVLAALRAQGVSSRLLPVNYAFHSAQMTPFQQELEEALQGLAPQPAAIRIYSTVSGAEASGAEFDAAYWGRNVREPVRFAAAIGALAQDQYSIFLEISPHPVLSGAVADCLAAGGHEGSAVASLRRGRDERASLLTALGELYACGCKVAWDGLYPERGRHVPLPSYPWQRQRYWFEPATPARRQSPRPAAAGGPAVHPLLGERVPSPLTVAQFEAPLSTTALGLLDDHRVYGTAILPGMAMLEMALAAAEAVLGPGERALEGLAIQEALVVPDGQVRTCQTVVTPDGNGASVEIVSLPPNGKSWTRHLSAAVVSITGDAAPLGEPLGAIQARCPEQVTADAHYAAVRSRGVQLGPTLQGVRQVWRRDGEALGRIELPALDAAEGLAFQIHPALLDAAVQIVVEACSTGDTYLPMALERFRLYRRPSAQLWSHAVVRARSTVAADVIVADIRLLDDDGRVVAELSGLSHLRARPATLFHAPESAGDEWRYEVTWRPMPRSGAPTARGDAAGSWLIWADASGVGDELARLLAERGQTCHLVTPGTAFAAVGPGRWQIDPTQPADLRRLLRETRADAAPLRGVVHLTSLDAPADAEETTAGPVAAAVRGCGSALAVVQALAGERPVPQPRVWLVTRGAQPVGAVRSLATAQAPLWGLGQVIGLEHPELRCVRVDLDPAADARGAATALFAEIWEPDHEDQVALRDGGRYVARLHRSAAQKGPRPGRSAAEAPVALAISERGTLASLALVPTTRPAPGPGEVEIRVAASGLNFKDVLTALGMLPPEAAAPLGLECAGRITAIGPDVTDLQVGDEVVALGADSFRTFVIRPAALVVRKPAVIDIIDAASTPVAFLTASWGLQRLARLQPGERVLIHAAAGGVGLAAVQLARRAGAEVFATVSTPAKRACLEALGVRHVMNSRTLAFADAILAATQGEGVDVVLNSLAGEFIPASLRALKPDGRFLELGKRGIWSAAQVAAVRPGARYLPYDLGAPMVEERDRLRELLQSLLDEVATGALQPLPTRTFPLSAAADAFRFMAQAKHIGKLVLIQPEALAALAPKGQVRPDATYLVTGGLGALGLVVAEWLVEQGARHLALVGRSAPSAAAQTVLDRLMAAGAQVAVHRADVSRRDDLARVLTAIDGSMPPLRGVIHLAAVLDDGVLLQQTVDRFHKVLASKAEGAWHLHTLTRERQLDWFVLFSSISAIFGSAGQGNYAAANAFLDSLAQQRRSQGLPALAINWGMWNQVGMAAALDDRDRERWAAQGLGAMAPAQALAALGQALRLDDTQVVITPVDWSVFRERAASRERPFFADLIHDAARDAVAAEPAAARSGLLDAWADTPPGKRRNLLLAYLRDAVLRVLGLDASAPIAPRQPLSELGLDSLMAVELRNALSKTLGCPLPATLLFDYPTIDTLADFLMKTVPSLAGMAMEPAKPAAPPASGDLDPVVALDGLSDDEAEALLLAELSR